MTTTHIYARLLHARVIIPVAIALVVAVVTAVVLTRPRTVVLFADCDDIGATAVFSDGSPAICKEIDLSRIGGGVIGGIWLWPEDYHPSPGTAVECISPAGGTQTCRF